MDNLINCVNSVFTVEAVGIRDDEKRAGDELASIKGIHDASHNHRIIIEKARKKISDSAVDKLSTNLFRMSSYNAKTENGQCTIAFSNESKDPWTTYLKNCKWIVSDTGECPGCRHHIKNDGVPCTVTLKGRQFLGLPMVNFDNRDFHPTMMRGLLIPWINGGLKASIHRGDDCENENVHAEASEPEDHDIENADVNNFTQLDEYIDDSENRRPPEDSFSTETHELSSDVDALVTAIRSMKKTASITSMRLLRQLLQATRKDFLTTGGQNIVSDHEKM
jgi:hypothetical protein